MLVKLDVIPMPADFQFVASLILKFQMWATSSRLSIELSSGSTGGQNFLATKPSIG